MYILKDVKGRARLECATLHEAKGKLGHGWSIWYRDNVLKVLELASQTLVKKDKASKSRNVEGCRVGGMHSEFLVHKVDTGRVVEQRVY